MSKDPTKALEDLKALIVKECAESNPANDWIKKNDDKGLLRYLKGHNYNLKESLKYLKKTGEWRHEYKTDELIAKYETSNPTLEIRFARAYIPMGIIGADDMNRPVLLNRMSAVDFPKVLDSYGLDQTIEYAVFLQEKLVKAALNSGGETIVIIDLGFDDLKKPPITGLMEARAWIAALLRFLQPFAAIVDPHYPEMFHKIFFTRAPGMFQTVWKIAKNFVNENTQQKIVILGDKGTRKRLQEFLPIDIIPTFLGGGNEVLIGEGGKLTKDSNKNEAFVKEMELNLLEKSKKKSVEKKKTIIVDDDDEEEAINQEGVLEVRKVSC